MVLSLTSISYLHDFFYLFSYAFHFTIYLKILNPTINSQVGDFQNIPVIIGNKVNVSHTVIKCIENVKTDWNVYEQSWDFEKHSLT